MMMRNKFDKFIKNNFHKENVASHLFTILSNVNKELIVKESVYIYEISITNSSKPFHMKNIALHVLTYTFLKCNQTTDCKQNVNSKLTADCEFTK